MVEEGVHRYRSAARRYENQSAWTFLLARLQTQFVDSVRFLTDGTPRDDWYSVTVSSDGDCDLGEGLISSFPVRVCAANWGSRKSFGSTTSAATRSVGQSLNWRKKIARRRFSRELSRNVFGEEFSLILAGRRFPLARNLPSNTARPTCGLPRSADLPVYPEAYRK